MEKEPFDDGHDWIVKDKETGQRLALFHDQNKVLPFAYRRGRKTVTIEKVKREGTNKMNEHRIVNLSEMMLKVVSEDVILPKTGDPEKEAAELTKDTGKYHYADYDDMINKPVIINTNVEAQDQDEWMQKAYNTPVNEETPVIEPSNFEKNDEYEVTVSDQVAESDNDSDWTYESEGIYHHSYLPLCYDISSGKVELIEFPSEDESEAPIHIGTFDSVEDMNSWIVDNIKEDVVEEYRKIAEGGNGSSTTGEITTSDNGVGNDDGDNYGPAPTDDQNDIEFDQDGKFKIGEDLEEAKFKPSGSSFDSYIDLPDRDDVEVTVHYEIEESDPSVGYQGGVVITDVCEKGTDHSLMDVVNPKDANRLFDEATQDASDQEADYADYKYDQMRDDRMMRDFDEGKDYRYDPDADDDDWDRQERFKQRKHNKNARKKEIDEGTSQFERMLDDKDATGETMRSSIYNAIRHFDYAHDAADHVFSKHFYNKPYSEFRKLKPELIDYFKKYGLKEFDDELDEAYARDAWESGYEAFENGQPCPTDPSGKDGWMEAKKEHRKSGQMDESTLTETDIERAFILSVDFTPERIEIEHKGMTDVESALFLMADGRPVDKFRNELNMGGLPMVAELERDNALTVIVLASTARDAIDAILELDVVHRVLYEFEIDDRSFIGLLTGGKAGSSMDLTGELTEDEDFFEAPDFVVSSENLYANELAEDPMFIQVMNDAYLTIVEKMGEKIEEFNPSIDDVDQIIETGIDSYPNGHKYSFMMSDPMARDAINDAFNILWDEGKIGSDHVA
ncbi:MAG: hypothetical protein M0R77_02295 [Gammaproteobacteria bacterium]|nr:hypothetical protein [Gammaproteobacteria bacterium]